MTEREFTELFKQYSKPLTWFAVKILGDRCAAEDAVISVFCNIWEKKVQLVHRNMLYLSVRNKCLNILKHEKRKITAHSNIRVFINDQSDLSADSLIIQAELLRMIAEKIEVLPAERKKVFELLYLDGLTPNEVASALTISINTVRVQKARIDKEFRFLKNKKHGSIKSGTGE